MQSLLIEDGSVMELDFDTMEACGYLREIFGCSEESLRKKKRTKKANDVTESSAVQLWKRKLYAETNIPKILKTDFRRNYLKMLVNTFNSTDLDKYAGFLYTYCSPNYVTNHVTEDIFTYTGGKAEIRNKRMYGIQNSIQHLYNEVQVLPDTVVRVLDTNLHVYSHSKRSKLVARMNMKSTVIYDLPKNFTPPATQIIHSLENNVEVLNNCIISDEDVDKCITVGTAQDGHEVQISTEINSVLKNAKLLTKPIDLSIHCTLTLYLDENMYIERMDIESHNQ